METVAPAVIAEPVSQTEEDVETSNAEDTDEEEGGFEYKWFSDKNVKRSDHALCKPKGGEKIIFTWNQKSKAKDFLKDGYRLKANGSSKNYCFDRNPDTKGTRTYYFAVVETKRGASNELQYILDRGFKKIVYTLHPKYPNMAFVEYIGDHTLPMEKAHGNARYFPKNSRPFSSTVPSIIKAAAESSDKPSVVYEKLKNAAPRELKRQLLEAPRDKEQMRNAQKGARSELRLTRDELYNTIVMALEKDMVAYLAIVPSVIVLCYSQLTLDVLSSLLVDEKEPPVGLYVDTTFQMGKFYATILSFCETEFVDPPTIPLFVMLHENRTIKTHEVFWKHVHDAVPILQKSNNWYIVSDEEAGFVANIQKFFPEVLHIRCWNHVFRNAEAKLAKYGVVDPQKLEEYMSTLRYLFSLNSKGEFFEKYVYCKKDWAEKFINYFEKHICPHIDRIGKWNVRKYNITDLTSNRAESINASIKRFKDWKSCPLDSLVLAMHLFLDSYYTEIIRGRYGMGKYALRSALDGQYVLAELDDKDKLPPSIDPEKIYEDIKNAYKEAMTIDEGLRAGDKPPAKVEQMEQLEHLANLSIYARGMYLLKHGYVKFNPDKIGTFSVNVPGESLGCTVRLFPKPECSCVNGRLTNNCHHIVAVQIGFGLTEDQCQNAKRKGNMTLYRQKALNRKLQNAGKKCSTRRDVKSHEIPSGEKRDCDAKNANKAQCEKTDAAESFNRFKCKTPTKTYSGFKAKVVKKTSHPSVMDKSKEMKDSSPKLEKPADAKQEKHDENESLMKHEKSLDWDDSLSRFKFESPPSKESKMENLTGDASLAKSDISVNVGAKKESQLNFDTVNKPDRSVDWDDSLGHLHLASTSRKESKLGSTVKNASRAKSEQSMNIDINRKKQSDESETVKETEQSAMCNDSFTQHPKVERTSLKDSKQRSVLKDSSSLSNSEKCVNVDGKKERQSDGEPLKEIEQSIECDDSFNHPKLASSPLKESKLKSPMEDASLADPQQSVNDASCEIVCANPATETDPFSEQKQSRKKVIDFKRPIVLADRELIQILQKNKWLSTTHINAALTLLRATNPNIGGLFNVQHGADASYPHVAEKQWVQIIHNNSGHWLIAAFGFFDQDTVVVYDSLNPTCEKPNDWVVASIASLLRSNEETIRISVSPCQQQSDTSNCGVFAIAFALALMMKKNPATLEFKEETMRQHLAVILESKNLNEFESWTIDSSERSIERSYEYEIFCSCRRPQRIWGKSKDSMAECEACKTWFHQPCESIPENVFKNKKAHWICNSCNAA